ncbi:hypothetical protein [Acidisphaera sp. L21]|uniref:hypothetical protein n=1 Tax=Acidisphaera sp. L21 TaxID=1641851 RepID=UPI00131AF28C|nr:hypothetical protein [Acidisphaera sp. L21]
MDVDLADLRITLATPCFGGLVTQLYMRSVMELAAVAHIAGFQISVELLGHDSLITRSRNALVGRFLDDPRATHLLFVDADIGFEPDQLSRMLQFNQDVVAGVYPFKQIEWGDGGLQRAVNGEPLETAGLRYVGTACTGAEFQDRDGFVTAQYAGTGFMLIKRAALLRMVAAYPELRYDATPTNAAPGVESFHYALFDCIIDPATNKYLGEDYGFCQRWRTIGGTVWLDTRSTLTHVGSTEFVGRPSYRNYAPTASPIAAPSRAAPSRAA